METATVETMPETEPAYDTREMWLRAACNALAPVFCEAGYRLPAGVQVSCGWPSAGGLATKKRVIGQCWDSSTAQDAVPHVFISPTLDEHGIVLATLAHELVHATVGCKHGHKGEFKKCMLAIGLEGKPTATHAGEKLAQRLNEISEALGAYPHGAISGMDRKKQTTRMLKLECPECGYIVRTSQKCLEMGLPTCCCGTEFQEA